MATQDLATRDFTRRLAAKGVSVSVLVCVVLMSGAVFGMAAQTALQHLGLDLGSIHNDLIADRVAKSRSAMAWWAWWMVAVAAVFVGPLSVALTRTLVANWWLLRGLRLLATAGVVLGLAAIGGLRPAPTTLAFTANTVFGLLVVSGATLLAALGARFLSGAFRNQVRVPRPVTRPETVRRPQPLRTLTPVAAAQPFRGGGSANSGLPFLRFRQRHVLASGSFSFGRLAVVAMLALVVFAAISVLGGATVLVDSVAPGAIRELVAAKIAPAGAASHARTIVLALLPVEERPRAVVAPVASLAPAAPKPAEPLAPRQRDISASVGYGGASSAESELTFAKGYSRRRAAQLAANMTSLPTIPQLNAAINIKKIRVASLSLTQDRRVRRPVADNRQRASKRSRGHDRYTDNRYNDNRYTDYNAYNRQGRHDRHRGRERNGDNRFARAEPPFRRF